MKLKEQKTVSYVKVRFDFCIDDLFGLTLIKCE